MSRGRWLWKRVKNHLSHSISVRMTAHSQSGYVCIGSQAVGSKQEHFRWRSLTWCLYYTCLLWLLLSVCWVGQIWPNWLTLWGLHTKIPVWIWAKTPVPCALGSWELSKWRLRLVSVLSTRLLFASTTLVDWFLPNPVIWVYSALVAPAWPCCQVHDWQPHESCTWNIVSQELWLPTMGWWE